MKKISLAILIVLLARVPLYSQHGEAEAGYWPMGYMGDTWTGVVTLTNEATREITLRYSKGSKTETFTGVVKEGYRVKMADGSEQALKIADVPVGARLKVYYMPKEKKVGGKKQKYYEIFKIRFLAFPESPAKPTPQ